MVRFFVGSLFLWDKMNITQGQILKTVIFEKACLILISINIWPSGLFIYDVLYTTMKCSIARVWGVGGGWVVVPPRKVIVLGNDFVIQPSG